ncbi:MAG: hypothetical protein DHS20C10_13630 [marine bacterium B5-7]|nr:MAG: hypothetical protein DHS20C10_13630 [marine bacterium B5-7]
MSVLCYILPMTWRIEFTKKAVKQIKQLSPRAKDALRFLTEDLKTFGPCPGKAWPHYSKLKGQKG